MPHIRPISDLRNCANAISDLCRSTREPVYITRNGTGDMVIMSMELYELREAQLELYARLAEAEAEAMSGKTGEDFAEYAKKLRRKIHGTI